MPNTLYYLRNASTHQWATVNNPFNSKEEAKKEMMSLYAGGAIMHSMYIQEVPSDFYNKWMRDTPAYHAK